MRTIKRKTFTAIGLSMIAIAMFGSVAWAEPATPVSVVDYMKSINLDSSLANRKQYFIAQWPVESYSGTAAQNASLLKHLLGIRKQVMIPFPSSSVDGCLDFYSNPEVAKYLTEVFRNNAIIACIVTGTATPQSTIRLKLQEAYRTATPKNGRMLTPEEHKLIHDAAYKAAGCKEDSAKLWGWYVVDAASLPAPVVSKAIELFGRCTISAD